MNHKIWLVSKVVRANSKFIAHSSTANSVFTSVSARRTFARPPTETVQLAPSPRTSIANNSSSDRSKREWPTAVRQYVQKAFATENNLPGVTRSEMESKLKQVISESAGSETLRSVDWEKLPLPQQMILDERVKPTHFPVHSPWSNGHSTPIVQETNNQSIDTPSKKRKSSGWDPAGNGEKPLPWRNTNVRNVFEDRISYPDKRQRNDVPTQGSSKFHSNLDNRKKRFEDNHPGFMSQQPFASAQIEPPVIQGPLIGQCQDLEKRYLRLTSAPNPELVRPLPVLQKTLELLKKKWKKENNYAYICDQFKSLRQDLTVQHIKTEFTVNVYEIHARIALEKGDLGEYNQCQTQLRALYSQCSGGHPEEFKAYRILYFIHTCNRVDMNDVLADLTAVEKKDSAVKHALDARSALALGNYHRFFKLYLETPNMGAYLMDMFVARERLAALTTICRA